jgi:hypothetical protein
LLQAQSTPLAALGEENAPPPASQQAMMPSTAMTSAGLALFGDELAESGMKKASGVTHTSAACE